MVLNYLHKNKLLILIHTSHHSDCSTMPEFTIGLVELNDQLIKLLQTQLYNGIQDKRTSGISIVQV